MDEKDAKIAELEELVAQLRRQLSVANHTIAEMNRMEERRYRDEYDHVPYEDDRYD